MTYRASIVLPNGDTSTFDRGTTGSPPGTPTAFAALPESGQVYLYWNAIADLLYYKIYYQSSTGVTTSSPSVQVDPDEISYTLTGLTNGTPYYFKIAAVGPAGASALSSEVSATPSTFTHTRSFSFDGVDERVDIPYVSTFAFDRTSPFSVAFWDKTGNLGGVRYILSTTTGANTIGWSISLTSTELLVFKLNNATGNRIEVTSTAAITVGSWKHITITYDGTSTAAGVTLYVNGSAVADTDTTNTLTLTTVNTNPLAIGALSTGGSNYLGNLTQLGIYNLALSGAQVTALYNAGVPAALYPDPTGGLLGWWRLGNNDTFPIANDSFGTNDGGMVNMTNSNITVDSP